MFLKNLLFEVENKPKRKRKKQLKRDERKEAFPSSGKKIRKVVSTNGKKSSL